MIPAPLTIARRELASYFHAPIAYIVGVLFLVIQGLSFWAVVEVLANPAQPAPYGAVLRGHFGGSVLYWMVLFLVVAVLAMRLVAEEKRAGTWEALLTTRVQDGSVLLGKWLGAVGFYALLWVPTLLYLVMLEHYAPPGASLDLGPVAAAYLGVLLSGAGFLALGLAASTATSNQIVAAVATFVVLLVVLVIGQLPDIAPSWIEESPRLAGFVQFVDVRDHMDRFARGAIDLAPVAFYASVTVAGLVTATALAAVGRRRAGEVQGRLLAAALVAVILVLGAIIIARHPARWDLSAERVNTLEATTRAALDQVEVPVRLLLIRPGEAEFAPVWDEVDTVLDRMIDAQPRLSRQDVDPTLQADRMRALAFELGIVPKDLKDYGAVVVQAGTRTRIVDLIEVAELDHDALGQGRMRAFRGEQAIASAIADATRRDRPVLCATSGHGELPVRAGDGASDWSALAAHLDREGVAVEDIGVVSAGVPAYCRVLAVIGPTFPLSPDEALAVDRYLNEGGRLLLALGAGGAGGEGLDSLPPSGLELVVDGFGITLPRAIAVDRGPEVSLGDQIDSFRVVETYGAHPITSAFAGRRVTVWQRPRALLVGAGEGGAEAVALVSTSPAGWGETELPVPMSTRADPDDLPGPVAIAAAAWRDDARVVVLGSEHALYSELAARGIGGNQTLAASAVLWLAGADARVDVGDKTPEQLRLMMTSSQRTTTFVACVLVIPFGFALVGGLVWRRRRRG